MLLAVKDLLTKKNILIGIGVVGVMVILTTLYFSHASVASPAAHTGDQIESLPVGTFEPNVDTVENRQKAEQLGMSPKDYSLKILANNPSFCPSTTIDGKKVQLFDYVSSNRWIDISRKELEALIDGKSVWKTTIAGMHGQEGYKFLDIDNDGTPELEVFSDGGGNVSYSLQDYYRWTGSTFEHINFSDMEAGTPINCDNSESNYYSPCLTQEGGRILYTTHYWTRQNREAYEETINGTYSDMAEWPREARLCKRVQKVYEYQKDEGMFVKMSEKTVFEDYDTLNDGLIYYCH